MIHRSFLTAATEAYAADRRSLFEGIEDRIRADVKTVIFRAGLPGWEKAMAPILLDVFDQTISQETDRSGAQIIDDLRADFRRQCLEALSKAKRPENMDAALDTYTRWVATAATNAAVEAAIAADDAGVGAEWVTMGDDRVRHSHAEMSGAVVPTGGMFEINGTEYNYPGQPIGDVGDWINCRCILRPTMLDSSSAKGNDMATFANASDPTQQGDDPSTVIVALVEESSPAHAMASGEYPHCTLLYLGNLGDEGYADAKAALDEFMARVGVGSPDVLNDSVSGRGTLGKDGADVLLLDGAGLQELRARLLDIDAIRGMWDQAEQFPVWIPHVTVGYPDAPANDVEQPQAVAFNGLGLWRGAQMEFFPLPAALGESSEGITAGVAGVIADSDDDDAALEARALEEEIAETPVPWYGILTVEGRPSGDGRRFAEKALTNRPLPLPLKWMPTDQEGHDGSVIAGRIDRIWRDEAGNIWGAGVFSNSEAGYEALRQIATGEMRGVSVDTDDISGAEQDENGGMVFGHARIAAATLCAIPAFAEAFVAIGTPPDAVTASGAPGVSNDGTPPKCEYGDEQATQYILHSEGMAYIPVCDEHLEKGKEAAANCVPGSEPFPGNIDEIKSYALAAETFDVAPRKTKDGPGWITEPKPTQRITGYWVDGTGAAKIQWGAPGDFDRCRANLAKYVQNPKWLAGLCANLHYRALGVWPGQHSTNGVDFTEDGQAGDAGLTAAAFNVVEVEGDALPAEFFSNPGLEGPTPLTITDDGRVFGHVATWGTCHIGLPGCTTAPHSATGYSFFHSGEVRTTAGPVAVGQITLGGGHADVNAGLRAASAHYDRTSAAVADVVAGEDEHGIWFSGALREGVTSEQIRALRASGLSGDWRRVVNASGTYSMEMVAALAVNVGGFPIPRTSVRASAGTLAALTYADPVLVAAAAAPDRSVEVTALRERMRKMTAGALRSRMAQI